MQVQLFEKNTELKLKLQETTEKMVMVHVFIHYIRTYVKSKEARCIYQCWLIYLNFISTLVGK